MAYVSKRFSFFYKIYIVIFLLINSIFISSSDLRIYFKHFFMNLLVSALMGFGSLAIYISKTQMKLTDRLEDIVNEKGSYSKTTEKFFICLAYVSLLMAVSQQTFWFYYSLSHVLGWSLDWAHRPLLGKNGIF